MLEGEAYQKEKLEGEISMLQTQLLQLSFEADEVCYQPILWFNTCKLLPFCFVVYHPSFTDKYSSHEEILYIRVDGKC